MAGCIKRQVYNLGKHRIWPCDSSTSIVICFINNFILAHSLYHDKCSRFWPWQKVSPYKHPHLRTTKYMYLQIYVQKRINNSNCLPTFPFILIINFPRATSLPKKNATVLLSQVNSRSHISQLCSQGPRTLTKDGNW